ncbi:MAG: hypothetical protein ACLP5J_11210 [Mycobacterium sp.]|uniref:hypothetical protein n=1 Tax=Mycobacterium sp. TaxID=1785 RepID=UPI003F96F2E7
MREADFIGSTTSSTRWGERLGEGTAVSVGPNRIGHMRLITVAARKALTAVAMATVALAVTCCGWPAFTASTVLRAHAADANYQSIQEPDAGYSPIIGLISGAARSVHITMYEFTDPAAVDALIDARRRNPNRYSPHRFEVTNWEPSVELGLRRHAVATNAAQVCATIGHHTPFVRLAMSAR